MNYYYLDESNKSQGPLNAQELVQMLSDELLTLDTLMATEGGHTWVSIQSGLPELMSTQDDSAKVVLNPPPLPEAQVISEGNTVSAESSVSLTEREQREIVSGKRDEEGKKYFFGKKVGWAEVSGAATICGIFCVNIGYRNDAWPLAIGLAIVGFSLIYGIGWMIIRSYQKK